MGDPLSIVEGFFARLRGPMNFRFVLQPLVACFFAFRDGRRDARERRKPFILALFASSGHRREAVVSACKSIGKVFVTAVCIDLIFQYTVFRGFPMRGGALVAGLILAVTPYLLLRGPVNRVMRRKPKAAARGATNDVSNAPR